MGDWELYWESHLMKCRKCRMAAIGHSGELGIVCRGIWTNRSWNYKVLFYRTEIATPQEWKVKSDLMNCLRGLKLWTEVGSRCDFLKKPKKAVRQIAQKVASKLDVILRREWSRNKMSLVIGSFLLIELPWSLCTPVIVLEIFQLSFMGLGRPCSLWRRLTMFRYWGIHWGFSLLAR